MPTSWMTLPYGRATSLRRKSGDRRFENSAAPEATTWLRPSRGILLLLSLGLDGCGRGYAPSFVIAGAYFPAWMLCALIGIAAAITAHIVLVFLHLADVLPFQLFLCSAVGVNCALFAWLPLSGY